MSSDRLDTDANAPPFSAASSGFWRSSKVPEKAEDAAKQRHEADEDSLKLVLA